LDASRVRSRAYVEAQKELAYSLERILKQTDYSEEAMSLRIIQALGNLADDPKTKELLPKEAFDMMRNMFTFLQPQSSSGTSSSHTPPSFPPSAYPSMLPKNPQGNSGNDQSV
jgi:hypothetical protein